MLDFALRPQTISLAPGQTRTLFRRGSFALQKMTMIQTLQSTLEGALTYKGPGFFSLSIFETTQKRWSKKNTKKLMQHSNAALCVLFFS